MDPSPTERRPSGIPRASRLPVPRTAVRPSPSKESLQQSRLGVLPSERLRSSISREQLNATVPRRVSATTLRSRQSAQQLRSKGTVPSNIPYNSNNTPVNKAGGRRLRQDAQAEVSALPDDADGQDGLEADHSGLGPLLSNTTGRIPSDVRDDVVEQTLEKSRPSLSERAVDTLKNIPPSPAVRRRTSSFFNPPESPMRPLSSGNQSSRPGSSHDGSMRPPSRTFNSRPTSRSGSDQTSNVDFRASTSVLKAPKASLVPGAISKKASLSNLRTPSASRIGPRPDIATRLPSPGQKGSRARSPSPLRAPKITPSKLGSKTLAARPLKPRASLNALFQKRTTSNLEQDVETGRIGLSDKKKSDNTSAAADATLTSPVIPRAIAPTSTSNSAQETTPRKSSLALRDQIAKAKAAKRAEFNRSQTNVNEEVPVIPVEEFDFGLQTDPFNQVPSEKASKGLLNKRIQAARNDGRLNIAAMGLKNIPVEVLQMYDMETNDGSWAEAVDLTRFVAAGNEIETIEDEVFPDIDPRVIADDDESKGNQFGGLETLDLHGNILAALPLGLRRLELLTTLNVSHNKLDGSCLEVISQIASLRDLKLGNNSLSGDLNQSITGLVNLETLDLQYNTLSTLPDGLTSLLRLRVLNLNGNRLVNFPFEAIRQLPLTELMLAKNSLEGTLISAEVKLLPHLQVLDLTANSITSLIAAESISLPALHQLNISSNRLTSLPEMSSWVSLRTLTAEDNNIDAIPEGFTALNSLRHVNFSGNNIRVLDDHIGNMENLDILRISGNPLRDKKLAGMSIEDLKRLLKGRIEPTELDKDTDHEGAFFSASASPVSPNRPPSSDWPVLPGGVLDRSNNNLRSLNPVAAANVSANHQIKTLELHHNVFQEIPSSIGFFAMTLTVLNLSHNELNSDTFLKDELDLPALKEMNLSSNTFNSIQPLIQRLQAPSLTRLDISFNRLTSLPPLKSHFPSLVTLLASNNTIRELSPEAVKGLTTLDCSSNEINSLNARIGLLGGTGGLQRLDVTGNRFRVPKYSILEKGTEATLSWLRDRIPGGAADGLGDID